jgi:PIN domain nuclease of toxin-antitoxin system
MNKPLLLDSHIFLWLLQESGKIGAKTKLLMESTPRRYISHATIWELGIKHQKGKLVFSAEDLISVANELNMDFLAINEQHIVSATALDIKDKDPFDRMLLSQSQTEDLLLITADTELLELRLNNIIDARE